MGSYTNGPYPYEPLDIENNDATDITISSATVHGTLNCAGAGNTLVILYYGTTDGGTTKASWDSEASLGTQLAGSLSTNITGLSENTTYYLMRHSRICKQLDRNELQRADFIVTRERCGIGA